MSWFAHIARGAALCTALALLATSVSHAQVLRLQDDDTADTLLDLEIPSDKEFTVLCGTDDCGVTIPHNTSDPTAPASGHEMLNCDSSDCYVLGNGETSPGTSITKQRIVLNFHGANECQGGTRYMGQADIGCDATLSQVAGIPFGRAFTVDGMCCTVNENGANDCDMLFTLMVAGSEETDMQSNVDDEGHSCDVVGTVSVGAIEEVGIKAVEDGSNDCGSNTRVGCVITGTLDAVP